MSNIADDMAKAYDDGYEDGRRDALQTTWLGSYSPYTCEHCGFHVDSKTRYCPDCGRKAVNYD